MTITREGGKLYSRRGAGQRTELLPESPDLFFRAEIEGRRLFHRDASGRVDSLIDRRNNEDLIWKRVQQNSVQRNPSIAAYALTLTTRVFAKVEVRNVAVSNRHRLQVCAESEKTAVTILHDKLAQFPRHVGAAPSEIHASSHVLGSASASSTNR